MKDIHYIQSGFETQNKMYRPPQELSIQTLQEGVLNSFIPTTKHARFVATQISF